jgi:hypothetical protein
MATGTAASDYLENKLLDYVLRDDADFASTSVWIGLCTTAPTDAASNEYTIGSNAYARRQIVFSAANGSGQAIGPTATVQFPTATPSGWGTVYGYAIFNSSTGTNSTNYLFYGTCTNQTVNTNDVVEFATSAITLTAD